MVVRRPPSMRDVAREAGVSVKTVSNVVNGAAHVRPATRDRVQVQIEALRYRPQVVGRQLRRGRTGTVALAVPGIEQPYFADLAGRLVEAARRRGLTVLIEQTDGDLARERDVADGYPSRYADGLVFSPLTMPEAELERRGHGTPVVLLGEHGGGADVDRVGTDSVAIGAEATAHLVATGRRRIAMIGMKARSRTVMLQRVTGYRQALTDAGLPHDPRLERQVDEWNHEEGERAAALLMAEHRDVDGIFAANDALALGALTALHRSGVGVPDDVAVVGVDDISEARYSVPPLTSVAIDRAAIAEHAVELLTSRLEDHTLPPRTMLAPHRLVRRDST